MSITSDQEWQTAIWDWQEAQVEEGIAASTLRKRAQWLVRLSAATRSGPWAISDAELQRFDAAGSTRYTPKTWRQARSSTVAFFRWAQTAGRRADVPPSLLHRTTVESQARIRRLTAWNGPVAQWTDWLRAGGLPNTTVNLRLYQVQRFAREMGGADPWSITPDDLAGWLSSNEWGRETLRSYRGGLRSFYGWAQASGFIKVDPSRLLRRVPAQPGKPRPASEEVIEAAMSGADGRQYLALLLGAHAGLRRGEIVKVHTADLMRERGGWSLLVHGKGSKDRVVPLLDEIAAIIREASEGWLFPNGLGDHISAGHLGVVLRPVLPMGTTPHQLRHRFASQAYQSTRDIRSVQELLGHASVATTQVYTAVGADALRTAVLAAGRRQA